MIYADAVIVAAGEGKRSGLHMPKQFYVVDGMPIVCHTIGRFLESPSIRTVVVALPQQGFGEYAELVRSYVKSEKVQFVPGGETRMKSVYNGLCHLSRIEHEETVCIHDAVRMFVTEEIITESIACAEQFGAALTAIPVVDTIKQVRDDTVCNTLNRSELYAAQTPQTFRLSLILQAYERAIASGAECTDDCAVAELIGVYAHICKGSPGNIKLTNPEDFIFEAKKHSMRTGIGYDIHRLAENRDLILGGVKIPFALGLLGHSDADVLLHAVTDALLGAAALGDIGRWFPDTDEKYKDADSGLLLKKVADHLMECRFKIVNIDCNIIAQRPKLQPYIENIRENIASMLGISIEFVSVKAKTNEGMDAVGKGEAIAAQCVCLLEKF